MHWYKVIGTYGPIGGMCHERFIYTSDKQQAKVLFGEWVNKNWPSDWGRMGFSNTDVIEISP